MKNDFAKLHVTKDGPCNPATMISTRPGWTRSALRSSQGSNQRVANIDMNENVSDYSGLTTPNAEAIDTVRQDHMEAYRDIRSPILCWNLLHSQTNEAQISSIDLPLPKDAPLPALLVAGLAPHRVDDSSYFALFHVDSGATCIVTNQTHELHCPMPFTATCGTASAGARSEIDANGTLALAFITTRKTMIPVELVQAVQITRFQRRSLRIHALKDLGFEARHAMYQDGNILELRRFYSTIWSRVPLITHGKSDYVRARLHRPSVAGLSSFSAGTALTAQSVARIVLAQQLSGHAKLILLHLHYYGCPGRTIMKELLQNANLDPTIPSDFHCPICMSEKTISLPRGATQSTLLLPIGSRLQIDFGFYKLPSLRGFCCLLLVVEARTSYKWKHLRSTGNEYGTFHKQYGSQNSRMLSLILPIPNNRRCQEQCGTFRLFQVVARRKRFILFRANASLIVICFIF
jgi:hypothetical protein